MEPEFRTHFKVKADIDGERDATNANLTNCAGLVRGVARDLDAAELTPVAVGRLLAAASRLAGHRETLSARFALIASVVSEARALASDGADEAGLVTNEDAVARAITNSRRRNAWVEDRLHEHIARGVLMIDTDGAVIGQINALTVRDLSDHTRGTPARVRARASMGRLGSPTSSAKWPSADRSSRRGDGVAGLSRRPFRAPLPPVLHLLDHLLAELRRGRGR